MYCRVKAGSELQGQASAVASCLLLVVASPAAAAPPQPLSTSTPVSGIVVKGRRATRVEGIDVAGGWCPQRARGAPAGRPRIVATVPRSGDVVPPGPLTVSLTFDQPMNCGWAMRYDSHKDHCDQVGVWDIPARRTWSMKCVFGPTREIELDYGDVKGNGFNALSGPLAVPMTVKFSTGPAIAPGSEQALPVAIAAAPRIAGVLECPEEPASGAEAQCRFVGARGAAEVDEADPGA